jgi:hypothetical protein
LAPAVIVAWCALTLVVITAMEATIHGSKAETAYVGVALVGLIVGLAIALRAIDGRRNIDDRPEEDRDTVV